MTRYQKILTAVYAITLLIAALDLLAWRPA